MQHKPTYMLEKETSKAFKINSQGGKKIFLSMGCVVITRKQYEKYKVATEESVVSTPRRKRVSNKDPQ